MASAKGESVCRLIPGLGFNPALETLSVAVGLRSCAGVNGKTWECVD